MTTQTYQAASHHLLTQARTELAAGDLRQASEKGWGAAAQIVKAIADRRDWEHKTHRHIWVAVRRLTDERPSARAGAAPSNTPPTATPASLTTTPPRLPRPHPAHCPRQRQRTR